MSVERGMRPFAAMVISTILTCRAVNSTRCSRRGSARASRSLIVPRGAIVHLLFRVWQRMSLSGRLTILHALTYFATILHADVETTAKATSQLLRGLVNHPTGEMSIKYVKNLLASFDIKCRIHGKVNEYLHGLRHAGWIEQVGSYIVGFRGRHWRVGEQIRQKLANLSTTDITNPSPHLYLYPLFNAEPVIKATNTLDVDVSEADLAAAMGGWTVKREVHYEQPPQITNVKS